jgi:hypothetical protein
MYITEIDKTIHPRNVDNPQNMPNATSVEYLRFLLHRMK